MTQANLLIDALDRLAACTTDNARWDVGTGLLARCGSVWLTAGTAPRDSPATLSIRTTMPALLMRDYVGSGVHRSDNWMQHCAQTAAIDDLEIRPTANPPQSRCHGDVLRLLDDHGVYRAILMPNYGGARPGGIVLYACCPTTSAWLGRPEGLAQARLLAAVLATYYRPDEDTTGENQCYKIEPTLTRREAEVLQWLSQGHQTAKIAERMGIEPVTVFKHLASARRKLGARTREQAVAVAVRDRLIAI